MFYDYESLIEGCKAGNETSKLQLIENLKLLIYKSIRKYYFGNDAFDDLVQEGIIVVLKSIDQFDSEKNILYIAYIQQQLRFFFQNQNRSNRNILSLNASTTNKDGDSVDLLDALVDDTAYIESLILSDELTGDLIRAFKLLSENERLVIFMYYYKGVSLSEIANLMELHYQTIVKIKHKALMHLRQFIKK